jgi:hypothetical protein
MFTFSLNILNFVISASLFGCRYHIWRFEAWMFTSACSKKYHILKSSAFRSFRLWKTIDKFEQGCCYLWKLHCDEWDRVVAAETQVCHRSYIIAAKYSGACIGQQIRKVCRCQKGYRKTLVSFKTYIPPPLPYFKVNISPLLKFLISHIRWLLLSNLSEGGPVDIFKCGSRKEKYLGSVTI